MLSYFTNLLLSTLVWKFAREFSNQTVVVDTDIHTIKFNIYLNWHGKSYNETEYFKRLRNFKESAKEIARLNQISKGITRYGFTKFADMSVQEFEDTMLLKPDRHTDRHTFKDLFGDCHNKSKSCNDHYDSNDTSWYSDDVPSKFDWREHGVVGPVLNQGMFPVCCAFSTVGVMESMAARRRKGFIRLSIQELMDLTDHRNASNAEVIVNRLCNNVYRDVITTEKDYPLTLKNENLLFKPRKGWFLTRMDVKCDVDADYIAGVISRHGPVITRVNTRAWLYYLDGVIQFHCKDTLSDLNHVAQIIGYDREAEVPHFIIRNSWGQSWGDDGYVKVAMDDFVCGIGRQIIFLDVDYGSL